MKKVVCLAAVAVLAAAACAAPAKTEAVADGFMDWEGLTAKNFLAGRLICPSDLRHKVVIYLVVDAAKFTNDAVPDFSSLPMLAQLPASHVTQWETQELPRDKIIIVSVRNAGKDVDTKSFAAVLKPPKGSEATVSAKYSPWTANKVSFYKDVAPVGAEPLALDKLPYIAVFGGSGTEPLCSKEKWDPSDMKDVRAAVKKGASSLGEWVQPLGVAEPQFYKKVAEDMAKGRKTAQSLLPQLKAGIKSKNPDQAKEAQIMYDALNQYKSDLILRIQLEFSSAPARAAYDFQTLVKHFPSEKKTLQAIDAKMKQNKEIGALGKIFEKVMVWTREDFVCKNEAEAKRIVQQLQQIRKSLETLEKSKDTSVSGEASLILTQIDTLIELMPTKVQQK